jgi:acetyltransferase-like isoleucine patch superfamily enzyme
VYPRLVLFALIFVAPPFAKRWLLRWFCDARIGRRVHLGWFCSVVGSSVEIGDYAVVNGLTLIWADGGVKIGAYSEVSAFNLIYGSGRLEMGAHCYIGPMTRLNVTENLTLGDVVAFGPRCMIFTHGSFLPYTDGYWVRFAPVTIGSFTWLAAGVYVPPGIRIGSQVFVHPKSVVTEDVPDGTILSGHPAVEVDRMERVQRQMNPRRRERAMLQVVDHFAETWPTLGRGLVLESKEQGRYVFRYRRRRYAVEIVPRSTTPDPEKALRGVDRAVLVVPDGEVDWARLPAEVHVFDVANLVTDDTADPVHRFLHRFMTWYYGIKFTYRDPVR